MCPDLPDTDFVQCANAVGCDDIGQNRGSSTPESQGIVGILKVFNVEFKRVLMGKPAHIHGVQVLKNLIINPQEPGTWATAQPFYAGAENHVGLPCGQVYWHHPGGLGNIDNGKDFPLSCQCRDGGHRRQPTGIVVGMSHQDGAHIVGHEIGPLINVQRIHRLGHKAYSESGALSLLHHKPHGWKVIFCQQQRVSWAWLRQTHQ